MSRWFGLIPTLLAAGVMYAEDGSSAWLRYAALDQTTARSYRQSLPGVVTAIGNAAPVESAQQELMRGIRGMLGRRLRTEGRVPRESAFVLGTMGGLRKAAPEL